MIERTLAKRYAAALLRVTDPEGSTEETEALLLALRDAYLQRKEFRAFLDHPRVPRTMKKGLLHKTFEGRARRTFLDFLDLLVDKNRTSVLPDIAEMFDRLSDASRGVVRLQVRSWKPLSDGQRGKLSQQISRLTGKRVEIEAQADPALKGGMLVRVGDSVLDGSVAYRLRSLEERLRDLERR